MLGLIWLAWAIAGGLAGYGGGLPGLCLYTLGTMAVYVMHGSVILTREVDDHDARHVVGVNRVGGGGCGGGAESPLPVDREGGAL